MPTIAEISREDYVTRVRAVTHLLLIGHTKVGKTDYVIQAALDGWTILYIDRDNGLQTIMDRLKESPEAQARIHYFAPVDILSFVEGLLTKPVLRYNVTRQEIYSAAKTAPTDRLAEIIPSKIPTNVIVTIDSWTALSHTSLQRAATKAGVSLLSIDKYGREIYGPANHQLTQLGSLLQYAPLNLIVQAHPGYYERKEKPPGQVRESSKEAEMIIKETIEVPQSSSLPHGLTLGKYFNQIGWMLVDRFDHRVLDFKVRSGRIGGGTPGGVDDPRKAYSWNSLFGPVPAESPPVTSWMHEMSGAEFEEKRKMLLANAPKLGTPKPAVATTPPASTGTKPIPKLVIPTVKKG